MTAFVRLKYRRLVVLAKADDALTQPSVTFLDLLVELFHVGFASAVVATKAVVFLFLFVVKHIYVDVAHKATRTAEI